MTRTLRKITKKIAVESIFSKPVTVREFLEKGGKKLQMELECGAAGLDGNITEAAINRPGLALAGFFKHFAHRRIQVFGLSELAYLQSLESGDRSKRLTRLFRQKAPCLIVARNRQVPPCVRALGEEFGVPVLRTSMITMHFINAATILMENLLAPKMTAQGTMVEIMGVGVLIEGRAGMGKSETALALIKKGHALVADDVTLLRLDSSGVLMGSPKEITRYHMEIRGLGIIHVPSLFGVTAVQGEKRLDIIASLCEPESEHPSGEYGEPREVRNLLGVNIPVVPIPVAPGRDLANLVETAALDYMLKQLGHDAIKELDEKLVAAMTAGGGSSE